jgi:hypothetical protein
MTATRDDPVKSARRWQFSLRAVLLCILGLSIVLAIASQFPRQSAFTVSMTLLLLFPLVVADLLLRPFDRLGITLKPPSSSESAVVNRLLRPFRLLRQSDNAPSLIAGGTIAILSTLSLVGLWPPLREIGLNLSLFAIQPIPNYTYSSNDAVRSIADALSSAPYWSRLWQWELWSVGRWWLLFGAITGVWLISSSSFLRSNAGRARQILARFLAFAPWFIVLEVAFLIGVWIESPNTVPEPSTGFVVGIFSWDLWHWDCWLDRGWLIRGVLPTFIAGVVFFRQVLRWRWTAAVIVALIVVPIALLLSVACTVAYQNGFPPLL